MYYEKKNKKYYINTQKYQKTYSMKFGTVLVYLVLFYIFMEIVSVIYAHLWNTGNVLPVNDRLFFIVTVFIGIIIHELIHAVCAAIFSPNGFKNIKIGLSLKSFVAYCNINEDLKIKHYKIITIMPFIILGILPVVISFFEGRNVFFHFGRILSIGSIGDLILFYWLCKEKNNYWVKDTEGTKKLEIIVFEQ